MNRLPNIFLLALLLLSACSADTIAPDGSTKTIETQVTGGIVKVPDDPAHIAANQGVIKWTLDADSVAAGFRFAAAGITFDPDPPVVPVGCIKGSPERAFHNCAPRHGGTEYHCNRRPGVYEAGACYKYTVTIKGSAGNPPPLDPWMKN